jgi:antitoxin (DNA-binding transcriptional repressor) of toxin-antitoxin stability system
MTRVSVEEAQAKLSQLIHQMGPGEEVVITENDVVIARLLSAPSPGRVRKLGSLRGTVTYMAPDFDAPLDDFAEYTK